MKSSRDQMSKQNKQSVTKKPRPEIRDDLDSRKVKATDAKAQIQKDGAAGRKGKDA
ncbi:MAG: hypothetical protein IPO83_05575 [Chitinophagaceae bacterium]|nr:hypothetical protein [Chitinophagaceae bacterium]